MFNREQMETSAQSQHRQHRWRRRHRPAPGGVRLGKVVNNAQGHPVATTDVAGHIIQRGRLRKDSSNDLWNRMPTQQDRINVVVVWLAQVERRLVATIPGWLRPRRFV